MINFAHRGASGYYPENTMLSFQKAVEMNCTGIETDVQMTRDGAIVLIHDEKVRRTTDGTGYVKDYTCKELCRLNAGSWFDPRISNVHVPLAEELLEYAKQKNIVVDLELKTNRIDYPGIEEKIIELIHKTGMEQLAIVSAFNPKSLDLCKEIDPSIKTALLYKRRFFRPGKPAFSLKTDAIHPPFQVVRNKKFVDDLKNRGYMINTWTVDNIRQMRFLKSCEVDGIMTNFPDLLDKVMNESPIK